MVATDATCDGKPVNVACGGTGQIGQVYKVPVDTDLVRVLLDPTVTDYWASSSYVWRLWSKVQPGDKYDTCTSDVPVGSPVAGGTCTAWGMAPRAVLNATGTVTLTWSAATANTDGTPLTDLTGTNVYRGTTAANLVKLVPAIPAGILKYVESVPAGTFVYAVSTVSGGGESALSGTVSVTVTRARPAPPSGVKVTVTIP